MRRQRIGACLSIVNFIHVICDSGIYHSMACLFVWIIKFSVGRENVTDKPDEINVYWVVHFMICMHGLFFIGISTSELPRRVYYIIYDHQHSVAINNVNCNSFFGCCKFSADVLTGFKNHGIYVSIASNGYSLTQNYGYQSEMMR